MNSFEREIFDEIKSRISTTVENTKMKIEISESEDGILHMFIENIGDFEGAIMTEANFVDLYKEKEVEAVQIFTSLSAQIDEKLFPTILEKVNQLNSMIVFGDFGLYPEGKQIFHRYVLPVQKDSKEFNRINIKVVWEEIWSTLEYLLPYILLISFSEDAVDLNQYMEAMNEAH